MKAGNSRSRWHRFGFSWHFFPWLADARLLAVPSSVLFFEYILPVFPSIFLWRHQSDWIKAQPKDLILINQLFKVLSSNTVIIRYQSHSTCDSGENTIQSITIHFFPLKYYDLKQINYLFSTVWNAWNLQSLKICSN